VIRENLNAFKQIPGTELLSRDISVDLQAVLVRYNNAGIAQS